MVNSFIGIKKVPPEIMIPDSKQEPKTSRQPGRHSFTLVSPCPQYYEERWCNSTLCYLRVFTWVLCSRFLIPVFTEYWNIDLVIIGFLIAFPYSILISLAWRSRQISFPCILYTGDHCVTMPLPRSTRCWDNDDDPGSSNGLVLSAVLL